MSIVIRSPEETSTYFNTLKLWLPWHDCLTVPFFLLASLFIKFNDCLKEMHWAMSLLALSIRGGKWARWIPCPYPTLYYTAKEALLPPHKYGRFVAAVTPKNNRNSSRWTNTVKKLLFKAFQVDWEWEKWYNPFSPELCTILVPIPKPLIIICRAVITSPDQ